MSKIFSYYTKYRESVPDYNKWLKRQEENCRNSENTNKSAVISPDKEKLRQKARAIAEPILLADKYEHEKAEDSESFFQTCNIELMSMAGFLTGIPLAVKSLIPFLNRHADTSKAAKTAASILQKYKNTKIKAGNFSVPLPKILTAVSAVLSGIFYIKGIRKSEESELGLIRKASFDATQNIINDPKMFAVLTEEQEAQINALIDSDSDSNPLFVDKLKERVNIKSTMQSVKDFRKNKKNFEQGKKEYFDSANSNKAEPDSYTQKTDAIQNQKLFSGYIKNVEHDVLKPLQRVEIISNISYSALFTGGFLEYLITDKLVDVLGVKNKFASAALKIGVPLITYLLLNKNIANIENKAILATKYKYLKEFAQNPDKPSDIEPKKKQSLPSFIKSVYKDMKEYDRFAQNELPVIERKLNAKKDTELSDEQMKEARYLQEKTSYAINNQREHLYNESVGITALSETILGPADVIATAIGGKIGYNLSKKCPNKHMRSILMGLGAVIAFIPAAVLEALLTKAQKTSEKIAAAKALKDMEDIAIFTKDCDINFTANKTNFPKGSTPKIFEAFN